IKAIPAGVAAYLAYVQESHGLIEHQVQRLERLVNDLVEVSRIHAGKLELHLEPVDIAALVRHIVEDQQAVSSREIRLHLSASQLDPVVADADRIEQVLTNFLTNALKYSPADQPVEMGLEVEEQQVRVWVRDGGPGIPEVEQEHIWERFHRVPGIQVQSGSGIGLGLGLSISREIIAPHQGQTGVESELGAASTFCFPLPRPRP